MTGQGLQARLRRLCPPCQASKGCVHCCKGCQMATKAVSTAPRTLQYLRHEHCCIGVVTEVHQPSCTACKCQTGTAAHLMVYKCWCTSRPKLPFLPQRGEAQAWSLARSLSRLQWLASNPCHKRATGRAVVTGCCPLLQDLLPTFKSAYDLGKCKQEREHTAVIDMLEQQTETTIRTAQIPCETGIL